MPVYEYRVIPAPKRGLKGKGIGSSTEERYAHALESAMNQMGRDGWDYVRADTLPCEERQGLTGRATVYQNMLVFRRQRDTATGVSAPRIAISGPAVSAPAPVLQLSEPLPMAAAPVGPARLAAE